MPSLRETIDKADNNSIATMLVADFIDKNFIIDTIEPYIFNGISTSADFQAYNAKIGYFGIQVKSMGNDVSIPTPPNIKFFNENNVLIYTDSNTAAVFNTVTGVANFIPVGETNKNMWFFRYTDANFSEIQFIGYKITLV